MTVIGVFDSLKADISCLCVPSAHHKLRLFSSQKLNFRFGLTHKHCPCMMMVYSFPTGQEPSCLCDSIIIFVMLLITVARIPISPYTRSPMSVSSHQSVTDRSSHLSSVETPHTSPTDRRITRSSPNKPPHQRLPSPGSRQSSPTHSTDSPCRGSTHHATSHNVTTYHPTDSSHIATVSSSYSKSGNYPLIHIGCVVPWNF